MDEKSKKFSFDQACLDEKLFKFSFNFDIFDGHDNDGRTQKKRPFNLTGGSENGRFLHVSDLDETFRQIFPNFEHHDVLLEFQQRPMAGMTSYDAQRWLDHCFLKSQNFLVQFIKKDFLPNDLRIFLSQQPPVDWESFGQQLQTIVRDNIYFKTVPYTTRIPRPGEIDGSDYRFVSKDDFDSLQRHGELLEVGFFDGNFYATPTPPKLEEQEIDFDNQQYQQEHHRKKLKENHRSSIDFFYKKNDHEKLIGQSLQVAPAMSPPVLLPDHNSHVEENPVENLGQIRTVTDDGLGQLPSNWEIGFTENGEKYFIDHNTGSTHWDDPRQQQKVVESESDLPYGWERVEDPNYGIYFVDHINKRTQYEKPDCSAANSSKLVQFTRDPRQLKGRLISTKLIKGQHGLGFTLVGNDQEQADEFLQIKTIIMGGPAYRDNTLESGDVLVYVNETLVLGYNQRQIIKLFQSISIGTVVFIQICRGYPLLFDPKDPTNCFVPQNAYQNENTGPDHGYGTSSMDDESSPIARQNGNINCSMTNIVHCQKSSSAEDDNNCLESNLKSKSEIVTSLITKGKTGFGFTITHCPSSLIGQQKIHKIFNGQRCKNLRENDIIVSINGCDVSKTSHADIVDLLRTCPVGQTASIVCRRLTDTSVQNQSEVQRLKKMPPVVPAKPVFRPHSYHPGFGSPNNLIANKDSSSSSSSPQQQAQFCSQFDQLLQVNGKSKTPPSLASRIKRENFSVDNFSTSPPSLPPTKKNGVRQQNGTSSMNFCNNGASSSKNYQHAIYENFHDVHNNNNNQHHILFKNDLNSLACRSSSSNSSSLENQRNGHNNDSHQDFASSTPNFVPISVYTSKQHQPKQQQQLYVNDNNVSFITNGEQNRHSLRPRRRGRCRRRFPFDVVLIKEPDEGFGFVIASNPKTRKPFVAQIVDQSPAHRCGCLFVGDHIIAVNGVDILSMYYNDIILLIKQSGHTVTLTIGFGEELDSDIVVSYQDCSLQINDSMDLSRRDFSSLRRPSPQCQRSNGKTNFEEETFCVELRKGVRGFGFSIRGGIEYSNMDLYVLKVAQEGPAFDDGRLKIGDQIIEINGVDTKGMTHAEAIELIRRDSSVRLILKRQKSPQRFPIHLADQQQQQQQQQQLLHSQSQPQFANCPSLVDTSVWSRRS